MLNHHMGMSENGVYPQWNSHLGIMISKTIGFRGTLFSDKHHIFHENWLEISPIDMERQDFCCSNYARGCKDRLQVPARMGLVLGRCLRPEIQQPASDWGGYGGMIIVVAYTTIITWPSGSETWITTIQFQPIPTRNSNNFIWRW